MSCKDDKGISFSIFNDFSDFTSLSTSTLIDQANYANCSHFTNYDIIFFMDGGRLVEQGTHHELLEKRGKYYNLYKFSEK